MHATSDNREWEVDLAGWGEVIRKKGRPIVPKNTSTIENYHSYVLVECIDYYRSTVIQFTAYNSDF